MTDYERSEIVRLRNSGMGYKAIAKELNISVNSIKTYCKRMNIKGERYLVEKTQVSETQIMEKDPEVDESDARCCLYCGSVIVQPKHGRKKKFCSNKCRAGVKWFWLSEKYEALLKNNDTESVISEKQTDKRMKILPKDHHLKDQGDQSYGQLHGSYADAPIAAAGASGPAVNA